MKPKTVQGPAFPEERWPCTLLFVFVFMHLWETCYKSMTVLYYIANCVSWVPRLTLLDVGTNWTYECTLGMDRVCMQGT